MLRITIVINRANIAILIFISAERLEFNFKFPENVENQKLAFNFHGEIPWTHFDFSFRTFGSEFS